jgi:molybdopterin-guanine dinucleotide biosynthesis protein B
MPPIVSIVGRSNSGKTTLLEKLVSEIKRRGYRVATIKHAQEIHFQPGKDSGRHLQAGSEVTVVVTPQEVVYIKPITAGAKLGSIVRLLGEDYDIILTEGFKQMDMPKIEIRYGGQEPLKNMEKLIAIVSDDAVEGSVRRFSIEDTGRIVDLLERDFIQPQRDRLALYLNGRGIALKSFPAQIIGNTILRMVSSLKNVGRVGSLDIHIRRKLEKTI